MSKPNRMIAQCPAPYQNESFAAISRKLLKNRNESFPVVRYFTCKTELVSNTLWVIVAIAAKVRRYQEKVDRFRHNSILQNNQRQLYREINQEGKRCDGDQPDAGESKKFWGDISSKPTNHNRDAKWLTATKQEQIDKTKERLKKILGRMQNWKSPGPDLVLWFWLKNFSSLHGRVRS